MSLAAWRSLYRDTVTIEPWSGLNKDGSPTYGTAVSYTARVVGKNRLIRDVSGQQRVATVTSYLYGAPTTLTVRDRITLPTRFVPTQPSILAVQQEPDERGNCYVAVLT